MIKFDKKSENAIVLSSQTRENSFVELNFTRIQNVKT